MYLHIIKKILHKFINNHFTFYYSLTGLIFSARAIFSYLAVYLCPKNMTATVNNNEIIVTPEPTPSSPCCT